MSEKRGRHSKRAEKNLSQKINIITASELILNFIIKHRNKPFGMSVLDAKPKPHEFYSVPFQPYFYYLSTLK